MTESMTPGFGLPDAEPARPSGGHIIRPYGDTTGDGMVQLSFTLPLSSVGAHSKVADGAATQLANKMGMDPALVVHSKPMGDDFTFFVVYGRVNHLVDTSIVEVIERDYPLLTPKEANAAIKRAMRRRLVVVGGCIGTDAHTVGIDAILNIKGFAGEKGLEYYRELKVVNLGAQVSVPQLVEARPRGEGRRRARLPGGHPARRPPAQHPRDVGGIPRGLPVRLPAAAGRGRPPLRRDDGRRAGRRPGLQPRYDARRGGVVHRAPAHPAKGLLMTATVGERVVHRRYVPYSHAHYAGNLVDGAYSLGLFGDVATEMCIRTDGDEGLFASYSDVQFRAPVIAGDVLEITCELVRVGTRSRRHGLRRVRRRARRRHRRRARRGERCSTSPCWPRPPPAPWSSPRRRRAIPTGALDHRSGVSSGTRREV